MIATETNAACGENGREAALRRLKTCAYSPRLRAFQKCRRRSLACARLCRRLCRGPAPRLRRSHLRQQRLDALEGGVQRLLVGQERDAEVVVVVDVEARAGDDQDVLLLEQRHREGVVVEVGEHVAVRRGEGVERAARRRRG